MASNDIILPKNFDVSRMSYGTVKQLENGGRTVYINYNDKNLLVQTPEMTAPFGVRMWPGERGAPDKYNIDMSFAGRESRPAMQAFFDMLDTISNQVVTDAMTNCNAWFKKKSFPSREVAEALYTPIIRYSKDKETNEITNKYPPNFKMNLPYRDGVFQFPVYDGKRNQINLMDVVNSETRGMGSRVSAIVQCSGVWLSAGKFGVTWKVHQLKITEPQRLSGYAFMPTEEDEEEDDDVVAPVAAAKKKAVVEDAIAEEASKLLLDSSEDELEK
jgi:hypothetical protein